jgi:FtsP/CotA-like multicopper oxidase with cupredoxin domain
MKTRPSLAISLAVVLGLAVFAAGFPAPASAAIQVQCPEDNDGIDADGDGDPTNDIVCMHISGGDGFAKMADGKDQYMFGFGLVPLETEPAQVLTDMTLKATLPSPLITLREGQELYLTMSNVGMIMRPDLFDPHSVHWHGFPNAAPIFDGLPEPSPTANMGASFTYYYNAKVPGTFFYHCHVEAAEHMQMGMIGNLWVYPKQDQEGPIGGSDKFAYNDGDGSTGYDVEYPLQLTGFDSVFHDNHIAVQALPFAEMFDDYTLINGRGYPDTVNPNPIVNNAVGFGGGENFAAQNVDSLITAKAGDRILLRVSNVSTTHQYAITTTLGIPMEVVGRGAALLRGPTGKDTSMDVNVLNVGGGQHFDVILDTAGVPPGTYVLYTTNLENLANGNEEMGGLMTEIVLN